MDNRIATLQRCLDNTAPIDRYNDLGLFHFAKTFFPQQFSLPFGQVHYKLANMIFGNYDPEYTSRVERQGYALVSRGTAKTTFGTFLTPIFNILFKGMEAEWRIYNAGWEGGDGVNNYRFIKFRIGEDFMLIVSETASSAENFVMNIKTVIDNRTDLVEWFGDKHPATLELDLQAQRRGELMWRKNAFITSDRTIVYGIGSGQQVRGRNVLNYRPTIMIADDIYSERNTKTEEAREKLNTWFNSAAKNSIDVQRGKIVLLGTMVHPDTEFKSVKKSDQWRGIEVPLISEEELEWAISHCKKVGSYLEIPSKEKCFELQEQCKTLSWKEQYSLFTILSMYKEVYEKGREKYFYQEFLNIIKHDAERSVPRSVFKEVEMEVLQRRGQWILQVQMENRTWECVANMYLGVDLASSQRAKSDDTAFVVSGIGKFTTWVPGMSATESRVMPYIFEIDGGKWGIFETDGAASATGKQITGWVNQMEILARTLPITQATIEIAGQTETIFNEAYRYMSTKHLPIAMKGELASNQMKKEERILSVLMPVTQMYRVVLVNKNCKKKDKFYDQLEWLGSDGMHDDYPDAAAYSFLYAREPMQEILEAPKSKIGSYSAELRINSWETL